MSYTWAQDPQLLGRDNNNLLCAGARYNGDSEGETGAFETGEESHDQRPEGPSEISVLADQSLLFPKPLQNIHIPKADVQYGMASRASIGTEYRGSVGTSIPQIIDLLKDNESDVRMVGAEMLKLSEQGM
jgi:hypothetical protein